MIVNKKVAVRNQDRSPATKHALRMHPTKPNRSNAREGLGTGFYLAPDYDFLRRKDYRR